MKVNIEPYLLNLKVYMYISVVDTNITVCIQAPNMEVALGNRTLSIISALCVTADTRMNAK